MRLFIAIDFDDATKEKILQLQKILREQSYKGRWKYIDNFHLTLKFLGEVEPNRIQTLNQSLMEICSKAGNFKLGVGDLGCFDGRDAIRVVYLGVKGELQKLKGLVSEIEDKFDAIGFPKEKREYSPHITIAQDVVFKQKFDDIKREIKDFNFEELVIQKIVLMDSREVDRKRVYTVIGEYELIDI